MMLAFISFFACLFNAGNPVNYYQVDYKSFYQLTEVNQLVDWDNVNIPLLEAAVFQCTNEQRVKYGKTVFKYAEDLNKAATYHSGAMVKYNFFSHTNQFEKKMKAFYQRMKFFGANFSGCAENIAYSEYDAGYTYLEVAQSLVELWMNSEGHRLNILNGYYKELGCGISIKRLDQWERIYATQDFGAIRNIIP